MMPRLSGPSRPPASGGKPRRLVILLHGLGADGNDLIGLAPYWARLLPDAEFLSPNAPFPCDMAPYGYQWFSSQDRSPAAVLARGAGGRADPRRLYRRGTGRSAGSTSSDLALVGFSQGTMMSLFVGLRRAEPVAGIVGFSGRLLAPELLASELRSRPPHPAGSRHRRPARSVQLARRGGDRAQRRRRAGRDADLGRHRPFDRRRRAAARRPVSQERAQRDDALTTPSPERSGSRTPRILGESHSAAPSTRPSTLPSRSIRKLVGRPRTSKACPTSLFGSSIDLDRFEPELGDERLDGLAAAAVLGYREHGDPLAEPRLQPLERGHLAQARLAPGGPEIDEDELAAQLARAQRSGRSDRQARLAGAGSGGEEGMNSPSLVRSGMSASPSSAAPRAGATSRKIKAAATVHFIVPSSRGAGKRGR